MAVRILFDNTHNVIQPTIVLATRTGRKLGAIPAEHIKISDSMNTYFDFSFQVHKEHNGKTLKNWDQIENFKAIWCKEWDVWFEIYVEVSETNESIKNVTAHSIGEAELSQTNLYGVEINTDTDKSRDAYDENFPTIFYRSDRTDSSLLHRVLEKVPHYTIEHVDESLRRITKVPEFTFDGTSVYDALQEIAEEYNCIFIINSSTNENGKIARGISAYDLYSWCPKCNYRGNYFNTCKCGNTDGIEHGYGVDTTIFVSTENLADNITYTTDTDSVKNCFKLAGGDDNMTTAIVNCNPNGSAYMWNISELTKKDMPNELVELLHSYDEEYKKWQTNEIALDADLLKKYNDLVIYYNELMNLQDDAYEPYEKVPELCKGYTDLMTAYYNTIDFALYLQHGLMPNPMLTGTSAKDELSKLSTTLLSVSVQKLESASASTVDNSVLGMARVIVDQRYQVKIAESYYDEERYIWRGKFTVSNYSDEENDTATTEGNYVFVRVNEDYEKFIKEKIDKTLNKDQDLIGGANDIVSLFDLDIVENVDGNGNIYYTGPFVDELHHFGLASLDVFEKSIQAGLDILIDKGISNPDTVWNEDVGNLYKKIYIPYYNKSLAISQEKKIRESEIKVINDLQANVIETQQKIQKILDFESWLGDYWFDFLSYRREDTYSNDNYISDGLNNAEIFAKAQEFIETAEKDIYKSANLQHSITATLKNLLVMKEFEPITEYFCVGNWIRIKVDGIIYRLRLLSYSIDFDNLNNLTVEFSDVLKCVDGIDDVRSILDQAASMATSYSTVKRQAGKIDKSTEKLNSLVDQGLNLTSSMVINSADQSQVWDRNGILCREYDPITGTYNDEQLKIVNSTIAITDDNWKTTKTAFGKYTYKDKNGNEVIAYGLIGDTIVGRLLIGESLSISNDNGGLEFGDNGLIVHGSSTDDADKSMIQMKPNDDKSIFLITDKNGKDVLYLDKESGNLFIKGEIISTKLEIETTSGVKDITNIANVALSGSYNDLIDTPTALSYFINDTGYLTSDNLSGVIDIALSEAKESGEFDGVSVTHTWDGTVLNITSASGTSSSDLKGEAGYSPIRGTDYWTSTDKAEIVNEVLEELRSQGVIE